MSKLLRRNSIKRAEETKEKIVHACFGKLLRKKGINIQHNRLLFNILFSTIVNQTKSMNR